MYFVVIYAFFGVNFILQKFCLCKKMTNMRYVSPDTHPFLRQGSTVISIHPLLTSKETKICEETEDIFLEVSSAISETAAEEALGGFLKQIYYMGISLEGRDKFIHVEKGQVISSEGSTRYFPFTFHI